ncbi:hypothetical protein GS3922_05310 [Geobacillus subterraneus]|uniref:Uncharacterized protein n=2 Tax=Geobacillus TaxID=129337 RepID=A0ABN4NFA8_9BACL|nr:MULTISPECIES: hypothetical protein [Geobacillus]AMX83152.1 hypothetical protein GS3922_05310 [Geobacillus subterraneus]OXB90572.1 hypothetical protein B9L21_05155 [Geobacillus uzenensis]
MTPSGGEPELDSTKSRGRLPIGETRWRACEEAVAAAAGPKRREPMAAGARQKAEAPRLLPPHGYLVLKE